MKKFTFIILFLAFSFTVFSQECEAYIPIKVGSKYETQYFDKKDKLTSTSTSEVLSVKTVNGKQEIVIESESFDNGESIGKTEVTYYCDGENFVVDMKGMLSEEQLQPYEAMDIEYKVENLIYPKKMTDGMTLPDALVEAVVLNEGMKIITLRVDVTNTKVATESITVPAGTYKAYKVTSDVLTKIGFIKVYVKTVKWLVKDVGFVRTETYSKRGKLMSYSVISRIW